MQKVRKQPKSCQKIAFDGTLNYPTSDVSSAGSYTLFGQTVTGPRRNRCTCCAPWLPQLLAIGVHSCGNAIAAPGADDSDCLYFGQVHIA